MTSVHRNDGAHRHGAHRHGAHGDGARQESAQRSRAHLWSRRGGGPQPAPEPDPVHPQPRPASATAVAGGMRPPERSAGAGESGPRMVPTGAEPSPVSGSKGSVGSAIEATRHDVDSELAADHGTPAVLEHRVVALSIIPGDEPLRMCTEEGEYPLIPLQAQVWARAGRLTVVTQDGSEHKMTVLGPTESDGLRLGDHWPRGEPDSKAKRAAVAAAHDVGNVVTFPAWLNRTTRRSGERNAAMYILIKRLRQASPQTSVYYGQTVGFEHANEDLDHPYDHRGIVGKEGYPRQL